MNESGTPVSESVDGYEVKRPSAFVLGLYQEFPGLSAPGIRGFLNLIEHSVGEPPVSIGTALEWALEDVSDSGEFPEGTTFDTLKQIVGGYVQSLVSGKNTLPLYPDVDSVDSYQISDGASFIQAFDDKFPLFIGSYPETYRLLSEGVEKLCAGSSETGGTPPTVSDVMTFVFDGYGPDIDLQRDYHKRLLLSVRSLVADLKK